MSQNGHLKIKKSDAPNMQTEQAFVFLVSEKNIAETMTRMQMNSKLGVMKWMKHFCVEQGPFTILGARPVDWGQVYQALLIAFITISDAQDETDE